MRLVWLFLLRTYMDELVETPVTEVVTEAVVEETPIETTDEVLSAEVVTEEAEPIVGEVSEETTTEETDATPEVAVEAIAFDANEDTSALLEKVTPVLEKYDIPQEVQAVIDVLQAKATTAPSALEAYSAYGDEENIKFLLERQSYLDTAREVNNGEYRPNTDEFLKTVTDPETKAWMYYDLGKEPSSQYQGVTMLEEQIINALGKEGQPASEVLSKYQRLIEYFASDTIPTNDAPSFIPENLTEAFYQLSKDERDEISYLDPEIDQAKIDSKLHSLKLVQNGLDGAKQQARVEQYNKIQKQEAFTNAVFVKQSNFINAFRDEFASDLAKTVKFSEDPQLQTLLSNQQVTLLTLAFDSGSDGEFARKALSQAGIDFDQNKAQHLLKAIEVASVNLTKQENAVDAHGNPLNVVELNKAKAAFADVGRQWQALGKETLDKLTRLVSKGTQEAVKAEVAKIKIAPRARQVAAGAPASAGKMAERTPAYGTAEWAEYRESKVDKIWDAYQRQRNAQ